VTKLCFNRIGETIFKWNPQNDLKQLPFTSSIRSNSSLRLQSDLYWNADHNNSLEVEFNPPSCWSYAKYGYESIKSIELAFYEEITQFKACAVDFVGYNEG